MYTVRTLAHAHVYNTSISHGLHQFFPLICSGLLRQHQASWIRFQGVLSHSEHVRWLLCVTERGTSWNEEAPQVIQAITIPPQAAEPIPRNWRADKRNALFLLHGSDLAIFDTGWWNVLAEIVCSVVRIGKTTHLQFPKVRVRKRAK